ncbi:hypothetical protein GW930_03490 [Candidatus Saccharibacteria bacterium]|nr:hypothetical protein [Candidatus Saccharibacteria bacterium]
METSEQADRKDEPTAVDSPPISWTAQEYIHPDKGPYWFILFGVFVLGFIAADVFFLQSWTFSALIVVMAVAVMVYVRRPPRTISYSVSPRQGLYIDEKLYHFDDFRSFGVIDDGGNHSIMLIPRKRFAPGVSVYFPEEVGEDVVDTFGHQLPMEDTKLDPIDHLVRKLRL